MLQYSAPLPKSHLSQTFSADTAPASYVSSVPTASRCCSCCLNHYQGSSCFIGSIADRQCCYCSSICCSACNSCQSRYFGCFCSWNSSFPSSVEELQGYYCSNTCSAVSTKGKASTLSSSVSSRLSVLLLVSLPKLRLQLFFD